MIWSSFLRCAKRRWNIMIKMIHRYGAGSDHIKNNIIKGGNNMKHTKKLISMMAAAAMTASLTSFTAAAEEVPVVDLSDLTIGACVMSFEQEFMANLVVGYEEFIRQTNINMLITDGGNMEVAKQVTNVENYISSGVDGILCQAVSLAAMKDTLGAALDKGIPVGVYPYDRSVGATTYFGYDEYTWGHSLGECAAQWAEDHFGGEKIKVLSITSPQEEASIERSRGWIEAAEEGYGAENIEWIDVAATDATTCISATESALQANPDIKMVLALGDQYGLAAYEALNSSGLDLSDVFLGACDGTDEALELVAQDTVFRCDVANDRFVSEIGFYWVENMVKIILGMEYDDPFPITTMAVTIDNVEEYRSREPEYVISEDLIEFVNNQK